MASAITIVVQVSRMSDGTRKVVSISEITGMEENVISMQEIFSFKKKGIGPDGKVVGVFQPSAHPAQVPRTASHIGHLPAGKLVRADVTEVN